MIGALLAVLSSVSAAAPVSRSLVTLNITQFVRDYQTPWADLPPRVQRAQGLWLGEDLVLCSAGPLQESYLIEAEKDGKPRRYPAELAYRDYGCMLALVRVKDPDFGRGLSPIVVGPDAPLHAKGTLAAWNDDGNALTFGGEISKASVFGFYGPILCLTVSTEAPGLPAGTPFLVKDQLQGLVYSMDSYAKQATVASARLLRWFLAESKSKNPGDLIFDGLDFADTANDEPLQAFLGLDPKSKAPSGVYITHVQEESTCSDAVKAGDLLLSVEGHEVDEKGNIQDTLYGRIGYQVLFWDGKKPGDNLRLGLLREGKRILASARLRSLDLNAGLVYRALDQRPRYAVLGGLVFQDLSYNYLETFGKWREKANKRLTFLEDQGFFQGGRDRKRAVVLTRVLPDKANNGFADLQDSVVDTLNGEKPQDLADFQARVRLSLERRQAGGKVKFLVLRFMGGLEAALNIDSLAEDQERILRKYGIREASRL